MSDQPVEDEDCTHLRDDFAAAPRGQKALRGPRTRSLCLESPDNGRAVQQSRERLCVVHVCVCGVSEQCTHADEACAVSPACLPARPSLEAALGPRFRRKADQGRRAPHPASAWSRASPQSGRPKPPAADRTFDGPLSRRRCRSASSRRPASRP
ncbi:hypothetical protein ISCGN_028623 [Ixodes scapularis]